MPSASRPDQATTDRPEPTSQRPVVDLGDEVLVWLPAEPASASRARRTVHEQWTGLPDEVLDDVALIITELVSNAVQHGRPDIVLRLRREPFAVDVAVLDHGPGLPSTQVSAVSPTATSGRGLSIVDRLAREWGVEPLGDRTGKRVWASLSLPD